MTKRIRPVEPGSVCHVFSVGVRQQSVFLDDDLRERFLELLEEVAAKYGWEILGWCLMGTHFHLLLRLPRLNLDRGMHDLLWPFAVEFNRAQQLRGRCFDGRYGSVVLEDEVAVATELRYIALNPMRAHMVRDPADWPWSSYARLAAGHEEPLVCAEALERLLGRGAVDGHVADIHDLLNLEGRPTLGELLALHRRPLALALANDLHDFSVREIANELELSKSAVHRLIVDGRRVSQDRMPQVGQAGVSQERMPQVGQVGWGVPGTDASGGTRVL